MGCCFSTKNDVVLDPKHRRHNKPSKAHPPLPPPPPLMEVETVKEVLSETPALKPQPKPKIDDDVDEIEKQSQISEVTEICSVTESVSTTTAITEKREDEESTRDYNGEDSQRINRSPVNYKQNYRSISGELGRRERMASISPNVKSDQSPSRRFTGGSMRSVQSRESAAVRTMPPRRDLRSESRRRDSGESGNRRSRSPVTRSDIGRSPSMRKTNPSPDRVRSDKVGANGHTTKPTANESLENPLVSLECFIFL